MGTAIPLDPFGSLAAVMRAEALSNVFCYSHVERVVTRAKDIHEMHSNRIASFEFVVRGWLRALRLTAFAQGHSTRRAMLLPALLTIGCAKRSHEGGLGKGRVEWRP